MNNFQNELQDLITRWLASGEDPEGMRKTMTEYGFDLARMAAMKSQSAQAPPEERSE